MSIDMRCVGWCSLGISEHPVPAVFIASAAC
jgi:hypothetical protein